MNNTNGRLRSSRLYLVEGRLRTFNLIYILIESIFELVNNYQPTSNKAIESLFLVIIGHLNRNTSFSTMIIHNFGNDITKLLTVYLQIKI